VATTQVGHSRGRQKARISESTEAIRRRLEADVDSGTELGQAGLGEDSEDDGDGPYEPTEPTDQEDGAYDFDMGGNNEDDQLEEEDEEAEDEEDSGDDEGEEAAEEYIRARVYPCACPDVRDAARAGWRGLDLQRPRQLQPRPRRAGRVPRVP
jgi:hypothetical protein